MKRSDRHARTIQMLTDLECARLADTTGGWRHRLEQYAENGYPTGSDSTGGNNEINRPTERLALQPLTPPAAKLRRLEELEQTLADLAREYHATYTWTTTPAKYDGPEPRPCINIACDHEISMIGTDIARNGRCPRCAQHYRRHDAEWPNKPTPCSNQQNPRQTTEPAN
jgi:hypothetical protein